MKKEDKENKKVTKIKQMVKCYIWLHYEEKYNLNLPKSANNFYFFSFLDTLIVFF
jgi:hypothetical protein